MRFPKLLDNAWIKGNQLFFPAKVLEGEDGDYLIQEYNRFKRNLGVESLSVRKLLSLLNTGLYVDDVEALLRRNKYRGNTLPAADQRRSRKS